MGILGVDELEAKHDYALTRLRLARLRVHDGTPFAVVCMRVTEMSARCLGVERVGLWLFERGARALRCVDQYSLAADVHMSGTEIDTAAMPAYVRALEEQREIVASDARRDPRTRELTDHYLVPHGITSMLDAPVFRDGDVIGVLCHEHVGKAREWSSADIALAATGADVVAIAFEQSARVQLERLLREKEVQLVRAQKLEALGLMAAKVAHDFNNVLSVVHANAELLESGGAPRERIVDIQTAAQLGKKLVKQLMAFVRRPLSSEAKPLNVAAAVAEILPVARSLAAGRTLTAEIARGESTVRIGTTDVERVVMNLVANARDASPQGSEIVLRVGAEPSEMPAWVVVEVRDAGCGMDRDTQSRVFDPFFTTKSTEGGTGLGLSTVQGIVSSANGTIDVESELGGGTVIRIRLPVAT
jgi:two-component system cell cycle sensor histidine kinase/response regulator CckA